MKTLCLVAILVLFTNTLAESQCPLCVPHDGSYNADSLFAFDTCMVPNSAPCDKILRLDVQAPYQVGLYTKRYYIQFDYLNYISLPELPADSIVFIPWQQIDTMYSATRAGFAALEAKFGSFLLRKLSPHLTDSTDVRSKEYGIYFPDFQYGDSIHENVRVIPGLLNYNPIPLLTNNNSAVTEVYEKEKVCRPLIIENGSLLPVSETAKMLGWRLVSVTGQVMQEYAPHSIDNDIDLNYLSTGIYFAIFPNCTTLIIFLGDTK